MSTTTTTTTIATSPYTFLKQTSHMGSNTLSPTDVSKLSPPGGNWSQVVGEGELSPPVYMYAYVTFVNCAIFLVGVVGNAMVIHVIVRMRTMRTRVNYFLVSLSVADLLVLIVCQPSAMLVFYTRDRWLLGRYMCKLVPFLAHWTLHASVLTLVVIGLDRYFSTCRPLAQQSRLRPYHTCLLLVVLWLVASLLALPFIFMTELQLEEYHDGTTAQICTTRITSLLARLFVGATFCLMFLLPLLLLSFLYVSVISTLRELSVTSGRAPPQASPDVRVQTIQPSTARSRRQVARMMAAIVLLFFLSFLPFKIFTLWLTFTPSHDMENLGFESFLNLLSISRLVMYVNSAGNPVIYAWMSQRFRRAFRLSLPRWRRRSSHKRGSFTLRPQLAKPLPRPAKPLPVGPELEPPQAGDIHRVNS